MATRVLQWLKTSLLIIVPLGCGALFFLLEAPGRGSGVFFELGEANGTGMYELSGFPSGSSLASAHAAVVPDGDINAFFIVGPPSSWFIVNAPAATLSTFVVDDANPAFRSESLRLPATIDRINARAYTVLSRELLWLPDRLAYQHYYKVLAASTGSRGTMESLIGLEIADFMGARTTYTVRIGPIPYMTRR